MFKDYEFGLKLAEGTSEPLILTEEAVANPDRYLSEWLVKRYRADRRPMEPQSEPIKSVDLCGDSPAR